VDSTRAGAMTARLKGDGGFRDLLEVGRSVKGTGVALDEVVRVMCYWKWNLWFHSVGTKFCVGRS
jgi:hypothetical protein